MGKIKIIGLGPGDLSQMPLGSYRLLLDFEETCYLRTSDHPVVEELIDLGVKVHSYDDFYEKYDEDFDRVYPAIVEDLVERAQGGDLLYAVPGHPLVAEKTTQLLLNHPGDIEVEIGPGQSFIDDLFSAVQADPVEGFQLLDALDFSVDDLVLSQQLVFMQVYHPLVAGDLKLDLMEVYPDDHLVARVDAAGSQFETVTWCPLYELDHFDGVCNLLSVYVPPLQFEERVRSFQMTQALVDAVYDAEDGDAWLLSQSHKSLLTYLEEESRELEEAIKQEDWLNMSEELGDLLMQVMYHAKLAENEGYFSLEDVLEQLNQKLWRRHPHIFSDKKVESIEEAEALWQEIKDREKGER